MVGSEGVYKMTVVCLDWESVVLGTSGSVSV